MPNFGDQPGWYFVVATLLPLLSFVLIFLASGMWAILRPCRDSSRICGQLYTLFGGDKAGRGAAYVAIAGIGLAFVFSLIGFCAFLKNFHDAEHGKEHVSHLRHELHEANEAEHEAKEAELKAAEADLEKAEALYKNGWAARFDWIRLTPMSVPDADRGTTLQIGFRVDHLSGLMFMMVTFVATLIHLFSIGYMSEELDETVVDHHVHADTEDGHYRRRGRFGRFFMFLSLFCFSMLNLILADNLFQVFVSWELVGICSYLLVGFYFERLSASNAANKAFITNRVGDAGFIIGLLIIWSFVGTFNFEDLFRQIRSPVRDASGGLVLGGQFVRATSDAAVPADAGERPLRIDPAGSQVVLFPRDPGERPGVKPDERLMAYDSPSKREHGTMPYWMLVVAGLGVFLGCVGKSAQFPLQVWLPDAMEGPTPVSALIHAATMVAAGVYLVGRCFPLFTPEALLVIAYTGGITAFVAATIAVVMTDIKKVLAYSTVSQLGFMMLALGVGGWAAGLFHLLTHAFFKALLFLGSGSVIYGCHHEQEMTKMGGLWRKMPITAFTMLMGVLAISGIPLFTGWYSKDAILASAFGYAYIHREHALLFVLPLLTAALTAFYMFRMWFMTFTGPPRDHHVYAHAHETPWTLTLPLCLLAFCSVVVAWPGYVSTLSFRVNQPILMTVAPLFLSAMCLWAVYAIWFLPDHQNGHEAVHGNHDDEGKCPWIRVVVLLLGGLYLLGLGAGMPLWDPEQSWLEHQIHHAQPVSVLADFGPVLEREERWDGAVAKPLQMNERYHAHIFHEKVGLLVLALAFVGILFAAITYYYRRLDPHEAKEQFPALHRFLVHKWYFDELYSALLVRPALAVAHWFRWFDQTVIDGAIHSLAYGTCKLSDADGSFDRGVVDGSVNLVGNSFAGVGSWLRNVQTGSLRNYVLFLVLAAAGIFVLLMAAAG